MHDNYKLSYNNIKFLPSDINDSSASSQKQIFKERNKKLDIRYLTQIVGSSDGQRKSLCLSSEKQNLIIQKKYLTKYLQQLLLEYDEKMFEQLKFILDKAQDQILNRVIIQKQFFLLQSQRKLMFRLHLSQKCRLHSFLKNDLDNLTYVNLTQCGIDNKQWKYFMDRTMNYTNLKIIITDDNEITSFFQQKLLQFKSFKKLKNDDRLFEKIFNEKRNQGVWFKCSENPDKLDQFNIYHNFKDEQDYSNQLYISFINRKKPTRSKSAAEAFKKPDFQQIDKQKDHHETYKNQIIQTISKKNTIINFMIFQNQRYGIRDFDYLFNQSLGLENCYDQKFIKARSIKNLKSILNEIQKISNKLLQFVIITIFGSQKLYLQFKDYEAKVSKIQLTGERIKKKQNFTKIKVPTSKLKIQQID